VHLISLFSISSPKQQQSAARTSVVQVSKGGSKRKSLRDDRMSTWLYFGFNPQLVARDMRRLDSGSDTLLVVVMVGAVDSWEADFYRLPFARMRHVGRMMLMRRVVFSTTVPTLQAAKKGDRTRS
jgi:hypothetical protein